MIRRNLKLGVVFVCVYFVTTLSACGDYDLVDKTNNVIITKAEYEKLKADAALSKQVGRYQTRTEGASTWRLDTATGESCLMLATEYYWEHQGKSQKTCS